MKESLTTVSPPRYSTQRRRRYNCSRDIWLSRLEGMSAIIITYAATGAFVLRKFRIKMAAQTKNTKKRANNTTGVTIVQENTDGNESKLVEKNWFERSSDKVKGAISTFIDKHKRIYKVTVLIILNVVLIVYFYYAWTYWKDEGADELELCTGFGGLIALYVIIYFIFTIKLLIFLFGKWCKNNVKPKIQELNLKLDRTRWGKLGVWLFLVLVLLVYIIIDANGNYNRLIALVALALMILFGYVFSKYPSHVNWQSVMSGLVLQFLMALLCIRWPTGRMALQCISNKVAQFLSFGLDGAAFAFGEDLVRKQSVFSFAALPTIYFFSMVTEILAYLGVLQAFVHSLGRCLTVLTQTSMSEGVIAVVNVFLGMTEAMLLIRPYLPYLTASEIHLVMSSGFGTVSGYILAIYIAFGAKAEHLVTASVMSAPAAICYAKLLMPETEKPLTIDQSQQYIESQDKSVLSAATRGASSAIMLVLTIVAMLIAFVAFLSMLNSILTYFGNLVGFAELSLELICGKMFMPLAYVMGVPWTECEHVGALIGMKTMVNEFIAYHRMGEMKKAGLLSPRSELIATYSLCGFTNPCSLGIMVGAISALVPEKKEIASSVAMRAFFTGCGICFMTASIAGLLMPD